MINQNDKIYGGNTTKLLQIYDITSFEKTWDRQVLQYLVIILGCMTQIEADEAMVRMASYNILEGLVCYNFVGLLSNYIIKNLFNIEREILGTPPIYGG